MRMGDAIRKRCEATIKPMVTEFDNIIGEVRFIAFPLKRIGFFR